MFPFFFRLVPRQLIPTGETRHQARRSGKGLIVPCTVLEADKECRVLRERPPIGFLILGLGRGMTAGVM